MNNDSEESMQTRIEEIIRHKPDYTVVIQQMERKKDIEFVLRELEAKLELDEKIKKDSNIGDMVNRLLPKHYGYENINKIVDFFQGDLKYRILHFDLCMPYAVMVEFGFEEWMKEFARYLAEIIGENRTITHNGFDLNVLLAKEDLIIRRNIGSI